MLTQFDKFKHGIFFFLLKVKPPPPYSCHIHCSIYFEYFPIDIKHKLSIIIKALLVLIFLAGNSKKQKKTYLKLGTVKSSFCLRLRWNLKPTAEL